MTSLVKKFKTKVKIPDLKMYIGRMLTIPNVDQPVEIETVVGNIGMSLGHKTANPAFYEINGKHLIGMLRFHAQMLGDRSITEQQFLDFENTEFSAEQMKEEMNA